MTDDEIISKWQMEIDAHLETESSEMKRRVERARRSLPDYSIWLHGLGKDEDGARRCSLLARILQPYGFTVRISDVDVVADNVREQVLQKCTTCDCAFIVILSDDASGMALDIANDPVAGKRLAVFYPEDYGTDYVVKSLRDSHRGIIDDHSPFAREQFTNYGSILPIKMVLTAQQRREHHYLSNEIPASIGADVKGTVRSLILLMHGILSQGAWQTTVRHVLSVIPGARVEPLKYELMDVLSFWFPILTRQSRINELERKIRDVIRLYGNVPMSVVAHSFGSFAIAVILRERPDIGLVRLLFCGAVVPRRYRWDQIGNRVKERVLNECGTRDIWPVLAQSSTLGYGATGTFGFGDPRVEDRYHDCGHSAFLHEDFVRKYWVPWFKNGHLVPGLNHSKHPWWILLCSLIRWWGVVIVLASYMAWRHFK